MSARPRFHPAVFALLALATFVAGTAGPLHEMEALRGHEHCADGADRESFRHECHDEDHCTVCGLLALPSVSEAGPAPGAFSEAPAVPPATRPSSVVVASVPTSAPARAPPAP